MIHFFTEDIFPPKIKVRLTKKWIKIIAQENNKNTGQISIIFCSDKYLLKLNIKFLNHNYFTDILTFNNNELNTINGDIYISVDTVKRNAIKYKVSSENELYRVIIHGILHLIGFDDKTKDQKIVMKKMEDHALRKLNEMKNTQNE